jgi:hypothetical protein
MSEFILMRMAALRNEVRVWSHKDAIEIDGYLTQASGMVVE